ncbi:SLBB domain-containing protein [Sediminibacterium ginsengisoli]|uniref:SLBB domain-containing protein n=1 Tax=Sediminibacterium ginsengisoli TaxID=413434 RepID=UPI001C37717E|nr:SLBB domain-containing protein [Sediminibacterium ginsengisoli]
MNSSGYTIERVEQLVLAKGMSAAEFAKLKQRINNASENSTNNNTIGKFKTPEKNKSENNNREASDSLDKANYKEEGPKTLINPLIFGSELYTSIAPSFEPNLKLATPMNYILGPEDQLTISVYGVQEYNGELTVSPEGFISIPNVGQIKVAGLTIEAATQKIRSVMGNTVYSYLKSGGAKLSVTLSKIRTIKITVIGSSRPGTYNLSSLATLFNALYVAGGPSSFGSFREIELIRHQEPVRKVDLYRFLLHGDQSDNIGLKDNDVIRIPSYKKRVELEGQVKRPGIFEVLPGEHFTNVLEFASGFTDTAYMASVKVFQRNEKERKLMDLEEGVYNVYQPQTGDLFVISKILNRFQNRVKITGAVFRPDVYELRNGMTVGDLIRKADGLKEDAFGSIAQVLRLQEDLTRSILSFDVRKALNGDPENNLLLKREDEVLITSIQDLKDTFKVSIQGEVRLPGQYDYVSNLTLKDLILQAGGFTDAAYYNNIEIARIVKRDSISLINNTASTIIRAQVSGDLQSPTASIPLQAFDVITIRRKAGYLLPQSVKISGQVQYPGPYVLTSRNEKVSDLLTRAGGFTPEAYPAGAYLKRYKNEVEKQKAAQVVKKIQKNVKDSNDVVISEVTRDYDQIPLDLPYIIANPGSIEDLHLKENDELYVPKFDGQVKISGAVLMATQVPYQKKNQFRDYISEAGGYNGDAWKKNAYVIYANGKAATTKRFLFFKSYPEVLPGSEVVVPKKPEKKNLSTGEIIGISSALASLAGVIIAILRL